MNGESSSPQSTDTTDTTATSSSSGSIGGGSGVRKQLPPLPEPGQQQLLQQRASLSASLANNQDGSGESNGPRSGHSYGPYFLEYSLLAEYNQIQKQNLPGVYVIPSAKSPLLWFGVLFIRRGIYQEGVFKFSFIIPENYPDGEAPRLVFEQPVFHPVIHPETGELDVKRVFPKWRRNTSRLWQVLMYARRVFYKIDTKSPLNPEAAVLYDNDYDLFNSKVMETVAFCKEHMFDPPKTDDSHAITFSPYDSEVHDSAKAKMLQAKDANQPDDGNKNAQTSGLTWMKKGTNVIFSREECPSL